MPGPGGLEATLELKKISPETKIIVLTQYDNHEYIYRFLKAGVSGYVLKKAVGTELLAAIRAVHSGGTFLYPSVASKVIEGYLDKDGQIPAKDPYESLTDRGKQVRKLIAEGHSNKEMAELLCISVKTIMGHRTNTMEKLNIHNRTGLVKFAIRHGLVDA